MHGAHSRAGHGALAADPATEIVDPAAETVNPAAETVDQPGGAEGRDRTLLLWLTNSAHATNHFQNAMLTVLYPIMMVDLGFGYAQVGVLTAVQLGSVCQRRPVGSLRQVFVFFQATPPADSGISLTKTIDTVSVC